jgi:hypothetical protein
LVPGTSAISPWPADGAESRDSGVDDERITWTSCPRCGDRAAVGWRITTGGNGRIREDPVSFDCNVGCTLTELQLLYYFLR